MRLRFTLFLTTLSALTALTGCKGTRANAANTGIQFPVRVGGDGDAVVMSKAGTIKIGDGQRLMFDLQREPLIGSMGLWACWDQPSPSTPLGKAVCVDDPTKSFEVTANFVDLLCRSNPEYGVVRATADIEPVGCSSFTVFAYAFEPRGGLQVIGNK